ncbi:MAG: DNA mismatch repair protein MutS [Clostridia bacterium]|nr:DNA mismatch repair protein MutS [Clostridia bacterium]
MPNLSPMMQQYLRIKQENPEPLLFFRVGDFYEMFFDDALTGSRELELTLTGKDCGLPERAPMCGVPFHAVDVYVTRLVEKGYKVAICEQMEDPSTAKGLVKRDIIRIITPGTLTDSAVIGEKRNNYLLSVCINGKKAGCAYADVSTGEMFARMGTSDERDLRGVIVSVGPAEIITNAPEALRDFAAVPVSACAAERFRPKDAKERLLSHFETASLEALGFGAANQPAMCAAGALMAYLNDTQKNALGHITRIQFVTAGHTMPLDQNTIRNLELTQTLRGQGGKGTLLSVIDHTVTAMGGRLLRSYVEQPLLKQEEINARLDAVEALVREPVLCEAVRERLQQVYDMERLLSKVSYQSLNPRDCLSLRRSLSQAEPVRELISAEALDSVAILLDPVQDLLDMLNAAISDDAPLSPNDPGVIRTGYDAQLDEYRRADAEGKQWLIDLEAREREQTGIRNLRIQYNRVFGYYIEVTKSNLSLVPDRFIRRQTLANGERYTTEELRELEKRIMGAQDQAQRLEYQLFDQVRAQVAAHMDALQRTALGFKQLDVYQSLARAALLNRYVRPALNDEGVMEVREGRHPVVEALNTDEPFIPNDTDMNREDRHMMIITGPNMAGKSTYMRQVALITLMAHMGSFVPAASANIPLTDCVFTRIGASDNLAQGQSTFMVEMAETAYILKNATEKSLVLMDEIGRGTSTFDGLSIAWAAVEYLADKKKSGALTLFATHYHELSELEGKLPGVVNCCVAVREQGEQVLFLRKIMPGGADKSFGIYVARLAGVPREVVARAQEVEARLTVHDLSDQGLGQSILNPKGKGKRKNEQESILGFTRTEFIEEIQQLDVLGMTPMDALNRLFVLREKALKL